MAVITLDATGVPKSTIVEGAYELCGLSGFEYERTAEELTTGLRKLNALMSLLAKKGADLGFVFPTYGYGLLEEPSGIPDDAVEPVTSLLAVRLAPSLGVALKPEAIAVAAGAMSDLLANYVTAPPTMVPANRFRSTGVRHQGFWPVETCETGEDE
jgi:hypothetical protein